MKSELKWDCYEGKTNALDSHQVGSWEGRCMHPCPHKHLQVTRKQPYHYIKAKIQRKSEEASSVTRYSL